MKDPLRKQKLILLVEEISLEDLPRVVRQKHRDCARFVRVLDQQASLLLPLLILYEDLHVLEVLKLIRVDRCLRTSLILVYWLLKHQN